MPTKARIPLPSDIAPIVEKCVQFSLPDDPEWLGMFWGALSQLGVWSSYDRDAGNSGAIVADQWKGIIDGARASECSGGCLDYYWLQANIDGFTNSLGSSGGLIKVEDACLGRQRAVWFGASAAILGGLSRIAGYWAAWSDSSRVGINVHELFTHRIDNGGAASITLRWYDCLGNLHTETSTSTTIYKTDFEAKSIEIEMTGNWAGSMVFSGPILCGSV